MKKTKIKFKIGKSKIKFELEEPINGYVFVKAISPWTSRELATQPTIDDFKDDIESLLPNEIIDQDDQMSLLLPNFFETINKHINKYGRIADADFCTYANYLALINRAIFDKLNRDFFTEKDQRDMVTKLVNIFEQEFQKIERTGFSNL